MWINSLLSFVLAIGFCLLLIPVFRRFGVKMHIYTTPGGRHVNKSPIPRLGGAPVFISFLAALCVVFFANGFFQWNLPQIASQSRLFPLISGATCIWLLGLLDDVRHIRARYKLLAQIAVAAGMYSLGLQIQSIYFPVFGTLNLGDYSSLFTIFWIVGAINAINLIDGIDGLCSGIVICSLLGILWMTVISGVDMGMIICFALIGCIMAFLVFNSHPATIFLGDSGAYFLGFMVAATPLFVAANNSSSGPGVFHVSFILFLLVPILDTGLTILRRRITKIPMSTPDRGHLHHRLLDKGYSQKKTMSIMFLFSLVFTASGITIAVGTRWLETAAFVIAVATAYLMLRLCGAGSLKDLREKQAKRVTKAVRLKEYAPSLFYNLSDAADWTQGQKILADFCLNTKMCMVNITCHKQTGNFNAWTWQNKLTSQCRRQPQISKTYTVFPESQTLQALNGEVCYQFHFCWDSEYSTIQNDTDALLEIISKTVGKTCHEKFSLSDIVFERNEGRILSMGCYPQPRIPITSAEKIHASGF